MNKREHKLQASIATQIQLAYPDLLWTISPAGFFMTPGMAMQMKRMGYRKGTPDLIFFEPRGFFMGLFIELKVGTNLPSDDQLLFLREAEKRGYKTAICHSLKEAMDTLQNYIGEKHE